MADAPSKDPSVTWRELVSQWEKNVNSLANQTMASEEFSGASNQTMNVALKVQQAMASAMTTYLATLNLPSRADITALGERLAAMETYLNRIALALEDSPRRRKRPKAAGTNRPPRTKRPPSLADES
jgi:Poly(R)-hydroxyalkanoic acid synthase subunit (PHA_synth_III_E)